MKYIHGKHSHMEYYSPLFESIFSEGSTQRTLLIETFINDESEYTGRYRVTIDGSIVTELQWLEDDTWVDNKDGKTEFAKTIGQLIANNEE